MNTTDNHFLLLYYHHIHQHGSRIFPYFNFDNMKFVAYRIKGIENSLKKNIKVKARKAKAAIKKFGGSKEGKT